MATATATIVSTDVAGSTDVRTRIGEQAADRLFRSHERLLAGVVDRYRGKLVKTAGDGILAAFESASEAVTAATAMLHAVARDGSELSVRIGIASGDVSWDGGDCFGLPVVTATRLQAAARPDQILVSGVVRALAGDRADVTFSSGGALELKGLPEPVEVYAVAREAASTAGTAPPLPPMLRPVEERPFVGREQEWEQLESVWRAARAGAAGVVLLGGEAGAGKTRLATEFALRCHDDGAAVVYGCCDEQLGPPYQPWVQALSQLLGAVPVADLDRSTREGLAELAPVIPQLDTADLGAAAGASLGDPGAARFRLFTAVGAVLAAASERWPVVLVLDDLHWARAQSLALLAHVARSGSGCWLMIGTFRDGARGAVTTSEPSDEPLAATLADLRRVAGVTRMQVGGLDPRAVAMLVGAGPDDVVDEGLSQLIAALVDQSRGNAFYVSELWHHLVGRGVVTRAGDRWIVAGDFAQAGVPDSVREVVADRLVGLDHGARRLAELAAVAGQRVDLQVLRAAADMSDAELARATDSLVASGMLEPVDQPTSSYAYQFRHALVRETTATEIPLAARARLHCRIAEAIEEIHHADRRPVLADLARHFAAGAAMGDRGKALYYLQRAAEQATRSYAYDDAASHLKAALALTATGSRERVELLIALGLNENRSGRHAAAVATSGTAFAEARALGDARLVAEAALCSEESTQMPGRPGEPALAAATQAIELLGDDGSGLRARLEGARSRALAMTGRIQDAADASDRAVALARASNDDAALAWVLGTRVVTMTNVTDGGTAILATGEELQQLAARLGDGWLELYATANTIRAHVARGDLDTARAQLARHVEIARRGRYFVFEFMAMCFESMIALCAGRLDEAEQLAHAAQEFGAELVTEYDAGVYGLQMFVIRREQGRLAEVAGALEAVARGSAESSVWRPGLAALYCELGRTDDARQVFESVLDEWSGVPRDATWPATVAFMVETCLVVGDSKRAPALYDELLPFRGLNLVVAMTTCLGPADRLLGGLAALAGRPDESAEHFRVALALADASGSASWRARVEADRGRWVGAVATGAGRGADRDRLPDGLSSREVEVLRLVAAGSSNRQIGAALFISPNTAANHIRAILQKTGCANRAEAAAYAARHELLDA